VFSTTTGTTVPEVGRRSSAPVISIGNLAMGGRGKTPVAIHLARLLLDAGERPAVLSRGYGRRYVEDGVVIVSDGTAISADIDRCGDEPMLIAFAVPGASVLVSEQRAIAAALAEHVLHATVHVLDDGFQHRTLARDVDLVIISPDDLTDRRVPFGRLREPVRALARADAIVIDGEVPENFVRLMPDALRGKPLFALRRSLGPPAPLEPDRPWLSLSGPALALAGIAQPERFVKSLEAAGWSIVGLVAHPDHHSYRPRDLERLARTAHDAGVNAVVTTEKDAVRLLPFRPLPVPVAAVPLNVTIEPIDPAPGFRDWIVRRLAETRG
jgi:tetraacyldisaccharide 4'-kinase